MRSTIIVKRKTKRIYRNFTPAEKAHWGKVVAETEAEREEILQKCRALSINRDLSRPITDVKITPEQQADTE
jgi:DNA replication initiation complex subunit (GINS family)